MNKFRTVQMPNGTRLQSGVPKSVAQHGMSANGLLLRGVVTATYVVDDPDHSFADSTGARPTAVYCDVMTYGSFPQHIRKALVTVERGGLHDGHPWKPKACTKVITGDDLDFNRGVNPALVDGDHVLIGFLNGSFSQPLILKSLPHPSADVGNEGLTTGHRLKLVSGDGDPNLWKHHGTVFGVDTDGNYTVDTTRANDGTLDNDGHESEPPTDGSGKHSILLPQDAEFSVKLLDMADPENPVEVASLTMVKENLEIKIEDPAGFVRIMIEGGLGYRIEGKDASAKFTLGTGAVSVAIADHLKTLWESFQGTEFPNHTHLDSFGGTGIVNSGPISSWDSKIESTQMVIPDNP